MVLCHNFNDNLCFGILFSFVSIICRLANFQKVSRSQILKDDFKFIIFNDNVSVNLFSSFSIYVIPNLQNSVDLFSRCCGSNKELGKKIQSTKHNDD